MHFLHRYDPQPEIFALYEEVIKALLTTENIAAALRSFELEFLSLLGYAVNLDHEFDSRDLLDVERYYQYRMEQGLVAVERTEGSLVFKGSVLVRMGEHRQALAAATADADLVYWFQPQDMDWSLDAVIDQSPVPAVLARDIDELVKQVAGDVGAGDQVVIMSNGGFGGIHQKLLAQLGETEAS